MIDLNTPVDSKVLKTIAIALLGCFAVGILMGQTIMHFFKKEDDEIKKPDGK